MRFGTPSPCSSSAAARRSTSCAARACVVAIDRDLHSSCRSPCPRGRPWSPCAWPTPRHGLACTPGCAELTGRQTVRRAGDSGHWAVRSLLGPGVGRRRPVGADHHCHAVAASRQWAVVPRPLRAAQGVHRDLRSSLLHTLNPRARLRPWTSACRVAEPDSDSRPTKAEVQPPFGELRLTPVPSIKFRECSEPVAVTDLLDTPPPTTSQP